MTYVIMEVKAETHADILARIIALGPIYVHDFIHYHKEHGALIVFGEVALAVERKPNGQ